MESLQTILSKFCEKGLGKEDYDVISKDEAPKVFKDIAKSILNGCFVVSSKTESDKRIEIIPTSVELYYHEENGKVKDPIVYHKNPQKGASKPIFPLGILHNHVSGIDITFEHSINGKVCRASALIRAFRIEGENISESLELGNGEDVSASTKIYAALYSCFSIFEGFSIEWEDGKGIKEIGSTDVRKNVAMYDENNKKQPNTPGCTPTKNGKNAQCPRKWRFSVKGYDCSLEK